MQPSESSHGTTQLLAIFISVLLSIGSAIAQTEKGLYSFRGGADGTNPSTGLVADAAGNLFGTTTDGGSGACTGGCGIVYELKPSPGGGWKETVIYGFQGPDGAAPAAGLILDRKSVG